MNGVFIWKNRNHYYFPNIFSVAFWGGGSRKAFFSFAMQTHVQQPSGAGTSLPAPPDTRPLGPIAATSPPASPPPSKAPPARRALHPQQRPLTNTNDTHVGTQDLPALQHNLLQLHETQGDIAVILGTKKKKACSISSKPSWQLASFLTCKLTIIPYNGSRRRVGAMKPRHTPRWSTFAPGG